MEFKSKLFETWLEEIKNHRIQQLLTTKMLVQKWRSALKEQRTYDVYGSEYEVENPSSKFYHYIPCMKQCSCWKTTKKIEIETAEIYSGPITLVQQFIEIDGEEYKDTLYIAGNGSWRSEARQLATDGLSTYLAENGLTMSDANLIEGRDEEWIRKKAEKENERLRLSLIAKVKKICGETIVEVTEKHELYLKGSNGRTAKLWAIMAGGYNIQCLHTRVLCKEFKE